MNAKKTRWTIQRGDESYPKAARVRHDLSVVRTTTSQAQRLWLRAYPPQEIMLDPWSRERCHAIVRINDRLARHCLRESMVRYSINYGDASEAPYLYTCEDHAPVWIAEQRHWCDRQIDKHGRSCPEPAAVVYSLNPFNRNDRIFRCAKHASILRSRRRRSDLDLLHNVVDFFSNDAPLWAKDFLARRIANNAERRWDDTERPTTSALAPAAPRNISPIGVDPESYLDKIFNKSSDRLDELPDGVVNLIATSMPYFQMRHYEDAPGQFGLEGSYEDYERVFVTTFAREFRRVLADDGLFFLNTGDCYANEWAVNRFKRHQTGDAAPSRSERVNKCSGNLKNGDLMLVPHRLAKALQDDGWYVRQLIIWSKPTCLPVTKKQRRFASSHEAIYMLAKSESYYYDLDAFRKRKLDKDVWQIQPARENFGHPPPGRQP